ISCRRFNNSVRTHVHVEVSCGFLTLFPFPDFLRIVPSISISASNTPIILLRNDSLPPEDALEKTLISISINPVSITGFQ
ncbi:MAG TPA: hypothetical protein VFY68_02795, partial [Nitrososphaeraceae archaeon]|nr:hypothetical protein [Nitrososphaeraceae archaeon]